MVEDGMIFQSTPYHCGPAAVVNGCRALGVRITEKQAARRAGTTPKDGTSPEGLIAALESVGVRGYPFETRSATDAQWELRGPDPVIICVHSWNHWITMLARIGEYDQYRYLTMDSNDTQKNRAMNGIQAMTWKQLAKIWAHGRPKKYFGIRIFQQPS